MKTSMEEKFTKINYIKHLLLLFMKKIIIKLTNLEINKTE